MARYFGNIEAQRPGGESDQTSYNLTEGKDNSKNVFDPRKYTSSRYIHMTAIGKESEEYPGEYESATISGVYYPEDYTIGPSHDEPNKTGTLFTHHPPTIYINEAYAHPNLRHTVPIMFSHMHKHLGGQFEPDEMLSEHSVDLYHKAKKLGLPVRTPKWAEDDDEVGATFHYNYDLNDIDADTMLTTIPDTGDRTWTDEISASEIGKAKQHYKDLRQSARDEMLNNVLNPNPNLGPQFKQLELDV